MKYYKPGSIVKLSDRKRTKFSRELGIMLPETGTVIKGSIYEEGLYVDFGGRELFVDTRDLSGTDKD
jgi:hypothetical protein